MRAALHPLQHLGHACRRSHAPERSDGAGSPASERGAVTNRCLATSFATVDGARPSSAAISLQPLPRSSILAIACRSCLVSLA